MKMEEVLGKERIRNSEERFRDHVKFIGAQHQAELATIQAQHQTEVATAQAQHEAELVLTKAEHEAEVALMKAGHQSATKMTSLQHEADIAMWKTDLHHTSEMLGAKLEMAEHRVVLLQDEIALARHQKIESTMLTVSSMVVGKIHNSNIRITQH